MGKWARGALLGGLIAVAGEDVISQHRPSGPHTTPDPYLQETRNLCDASRPSIWPCLQSRLLERLEAFLSSEHRLSDHTILARTSRAADMKEAEGRNFPGLAGYLARKAWEYAATTDLVLEFPPSLTGGDPAMAPRFIDEVFNEFDTIDNKHEKPQIRNQLKKLFIPLLIILKIFKLKLLFLLPLILGVASFKKLIGFLAILIPGVIGYLKLCRSGQDYGAHGHSSYYNRPPHRRHRFRPEGFDPYEPFGSHEFADVHPDYLPDYLRSPSRTADTHRPNAHTHSSTTSRRPPSDAESDHQTEIQNFWKGQNDYLPYKGYYNVASVDRN